MNGGKSIFMVLLCRNGVWGARLPSMVPKHRYQLEMHACCAANKVAGKITHWGADPEVAKDGDH